MTGVSEPAPLVMTEVARRRRRFVALQLLIALLAVVPIVYAMARGLDVSFDSIQYLSAARNLLAGRGLSVFDAPGLPVCTRLPRRAL
jgi:hypothetical protein